MHAPERLLGVLAVSVLVASAIGFAIEVRPSRYELRGFRVREPAPTADASLPDARPARSYDELSVRPWRSGPETSWIADVDALRSGFGAALPPDGAEHGLTPIALEDRTRMRAFEGAPPMIPHPVAASGAAECLACHGDGVRLGALWARPLPHPAYASCTQCHVTAVSEIPHAADVPALAPPTSIDEQSEFAPREAPAFGTRAWVGAPPTLPHSTQNRGECLACHGPSARPGMRSSHPERVSCLQCHAPGAGLDQRGDHAE